MKISYSCTRNISQKINSHNNEIINEFHSRVNNNNINSKKIECNCKSRSDCPMNGLCNLDNVVYQAIIYPKEDINDRKSYIGISSTNLSKLDKPDMKKQGRAHKWCTPMDPHIWPKKSRTTS